MPHVDGAIDRARTAALRSSKDNKPARPRESGDPGQHAQAGVSGPGFPLSREWADHVPLLRSFAEMTVQLDRIPYSPIDRRPRLAWPNDARIALWLVPNVEHY